MHKSSFNNFLSDGKNGFSEAEGITVLSLFDGMSCGQLALQKLGIKVKQYYASEIDKFAIKIAQKNFPNTIQLGDVTKVFAKDLPKIDLLIGGSPCQGLSFAGKKLAFDDPRSRLFFEFVRLKNECAPTWFMLENVMMRKDYQAIISRYLGIAPLKINSTLVSAQNRERNYWTSIYSRPYGLFGEMKCAIPQPKDKGILLRNILEKEVPDKYYLSENLLNYFSKRAANYNNGKVNIRDEEGKASCLTASYEKHDIADNYIKIDTNLRVAANQDKANCFTAGGHSGGLHSDMTLIGAVKFGRTEEAKQMRRESMANGKDSNPFAKKQITALANKMSTLTTAGTKDNLVMQIMGNKANTLTPDAYLATGERKRDQNGTKGLTSMCDRRLRRLTPTECERLQTLPDGYTSGVSDTQRYRMLGNGWTVDVIAHIFSYLKTELESGKR